MTDNRDVTAISGIGETRAQALAEVGFETVADVRAADESALTDATGIGESRASTVMSTVEEMEDPTGSPSSETDADTESTPPAADTGTETATTASPSSSADDPDAESDQQGAIDRIKETVSATLSGPQADEDETDLTRLGSVRPQKAVALQEAGFETIADVAHADPTALTAAEGVDDTNANYLQEAAAQLIGVPAEDGGDGGNGGDDRYEPGSESPTETSTSVEDTKGTEDTDDQPPRDNDTASDHHPPTPQTEPHGDHDALADTTADTDDGSGGGGIAAKGAGAVKTAARAVVNPASVVQDGGATAAENGTHPTADDDQQLGDEAIAEVADATGVSPSKARELLQSASENENVGLTADQDAATASVTTDNSDIEETYAADLIAPASLRLEPSSTQTSDVHTKVIYIEGYPDFAKVKMFEQLFAESDNVDVDMSIHVGSHDRLDAIGHIRDAIEDLQVRVAQKDDESDVTLRDTARRLEGHEDVYDIAENPAT